MGRQDTNIPKRRNRRIIALGDLNEKISLQTRVQQSAFESGNNSDQEVFSTIATPWCCVETYRGKNYFDNIEQGANPTHVFIIRYRPLTTQEYWIIYRGTRFDILDVENLDERSEFLKFMCKASGEVTTTPTGTTPVEGGWG